MSLVECISLLMHCNMRIYLYSKGNPPLDTWQIIDIQVIIDDRYQFISRLIIWIFWKSTIWLEFQFNDSGIPFHWEIPLLKPLQGNTNNWIPSLSIRTYVRGGKGDHSISGHLGRVVWPIRAKQPPCFFRRKPVKKTSFSLQSNSNGINVIKYNRY